MRAARRNPVGLPSSASVVRLGSGEHTHFLNPKTGLTLCESGAGRAKSSQPIYRSTAKQVTCYRCVKLAKMNLEAGREPWQGP
jgi:hypothetical protein